MMTSTRRYAFSTYGMKDMPSKFELWETFGEDGSSESIELCEEGKFVNLNPQFKAPVLLKVFETEDVDEASQMRNDYMGWGKYYPMTDDLTERDTMEVFQTPPTYEDWIGQVAADDMDFSEIRSFLRDQNLISENQIVVGIQIGVDSVSPTEPLIFALVVEANNEDEVRALIEDSSHPIPVRKIWVNISTVEFISFFLRLRINMSPRNLNILGRTVDVLWN